MKHIVTISRNRYNSLLRAENVARAFRRAMTAPVMDSKTPSKWDDAYRSVLGWLRAAGNKEHGRPPEINRNWLK